MTGNHSRLVNLVKERQMSLSLLQGGIRLSNQRNALYLSRLNPDALMFQAGYLTVAIDQKPQGPGFLVDFPNLEVRAALIPLLLSLGPEFQTPRESPRLSQAFVAALANRDASAVLKAFESLLDSIPPTIQVAYEAYYQTIFLLALGMAGQRFIAEEDPDGGWLNVSFQSKSGDHFVFELERIPLTELTPPAETEAKSEAAGGQASKAAAKKAAAEALIKVKAERQIEEALSQIDENICAYRFMGLGGDIWKTAMVFGRRRLLKIVFQKAENWTLTEDEDGNYVVEDA
jgi:hypothetical protein